ncbi:single-stranded DNA-binding protein [Metapseudomonas furukawaii]|uniref:single-stranded DNA-binding protein n=1 Tax=Metapseudomonas furukawaii TaxID=1149133 RepID=UPI00227B2D9C|nr:single-stranded DNA-binding protein [Pseudomonas furukawaii]WAG77015.1 single-stranded DNA-binding protein [Pseudomonas furukawaii]
MSNLNRWEGIGRLGQDIELRYLPDGRAVANFNIGVDDSYKSKQTGQRVEQTEWVRCVAFGPTAEFLGQWLRKGARLLAVGKLKTREYEKDGSKRYVTEIHLAQGTEIIDWPAKDSQPRQPAQQAPRNGSRPQPGQQAAPPDYDSFDDDIPFAPAHYLMGV